MYFQTVNEFWLKRPLTKVIIKFKIFILKVKKKELVRFFFVFLVGLNLLSLIQTHPIIAFHIYFILVVYSYAGN